MKTDEPQGEYKASALDKIMDVEVTELGAIRTRQAVTIEDYKAALKELEEMRQINDWALKLAERIIDLKHEKTGRLSLLAKSYLWTSAT